MSSTFGSLNIAKSGLQYQQIAIDTANNNIANVNTDGYVRRRAVAAEVGGPGQPVMWSRSDGHGQGVTTQSVQRLTDILLGSRVRTEHGNLSYLTVQQTSMERLESAIDEPSDNGVAQAISDFGSAWQDLVTSPDGTAARQSAVAAGQTLAAAIRTQARAVDDEVSEQAAGALQDLSDVNQGAQQMAQLNHSIFIAQANGSDVGDLEDQRDQLALDLADKAGAVTTVQPNGMYTVTIGGVALVDGVDAGTLVQTGIDPTTDTLSGGTSTGGQVQYAITKPVPPGQAADTAHSSAVSVSSGDLGGVTALLNVTLTGYRQQLNTVAGNIITVVNAQHQAGFDQSGVGGEPFFQTSAASDPAGTITVNADLVAHPDKVAASAIGGDNDATNADRMYQVLTGAAPARGPQPGSPVLDASSTPVPGIDVEDQYRTMVAGLGSTAAGLNTQQTNQQLLTTQVDDELEQTAGVSLDEETINLMQAQRAYQASSRVLSVLDSILDTLINHTGA